MQVYPRRCTFDKQHAALPSPGVHKQQPKLRLPSVLRLDHQMMRVPPCYARYVDLLRVGAELKPYDRRGWRARGRTERQKTGHRLHRRRLQHRRRLRQPYGHDANPHLGIPRACKRVAVRLLSSRVIDVMRDGEEWDSTFIALLEGQKEGPIARWW